MSARICVCGHARGEHRDSGPDEWLECESEMPDYEHRERRSCACRQFRPAVPPVDAPDGGGTPCDSCDPSFSCWDQSTACRKPIPAPTAAAFPVDAEPPHD